MTLVRILIALIVLLGFAVGYFYQMWQNEKSANALWEIAYQSCNETRQYYETQYTKYWNLYNALPWSGYNG